MVRSLLTLPRVAPRPLTYSLNFGGLDSGKLVDFPFLFDPSATDWSCGIFFKTNFYAKDLSPLQSMSIVCQLDGTGTGRSWSGLFRTTMQIQDSFSGATNTTPFVVSNLGWHHVFETFELATSTRRFYVNGVFVHSQVVTIEAANGGMRIGSNKATTRNITGNLTEFRVWNRKFSDQEAADYFYNNNFSRTNLQLEALFTEGSGTGVADTSGNAKHGTITGATWSSDLPPFKARPALVTARTAISSARSLAS